MKTARENIRRCFPPSRLGSSLAENLLRGSVSEIGESNRHLASCSSDQRRSLQEIAHRDVSGLAEECPDTNKTRTIYRVCPEATHSFEVTKRHLWRLFLPHIRKSHSQRQRASRDHGQWYTDRTWDPIGGFDKRPPFRQRTWRIDERRRIAHLEQK